MNTTNHVTAIYDACVLYPAPLRDLLMQLAMTELFSAKWTALIANLILLYPQAVANAVDCCRQRLRNPPKSVDEFLEILLRQGLTRSCSLLRQTI
jgi:hypothetical protein